MHLINKQILDLKLIGKWQDDSPMEHARALYYEKILPVLEEVFDEISGDEVIRIDRLVLNLGTINVDYLKETIKEQMIKSLPKITKNPIYSDTQITDNEAFIYFLKTGNLPWYFTKTIDFDLDDWLENLFDEKHDSLISSIKSVLNFTHVIERLVEQFDEKIIQKIIELLLEKYTSNEIFLWFQFLIHSENIHKFFTQKAVNKFILKAIFIENNVKIEHLIEAFFLKIKSQATDYKHFTKILLNEIENNLSIQSTLKNTIVTSIENSLISEVKSSNFQKNEPLNEYKTAVENYQISNAGLILLHPYLKIYLKTVGGFSEDDFELMENRVKSVQLLHYLSTGSSKTPEFELNLNKMLCNVPINQPIPAQIGITKFIKDETEEFLEAIIGYWTALKNTGIEGLRSTFLQRNGSLEESENSWIVRVEQKTPDVLLDYFPWGFRQFMLPFGRKMVYVEW